MYYYSLKGKGKKNIIYGGKVWFSEKKNCITI